MLAVEGLAHRDLDGVAGANKPREHEGPRHGLEDGEVKANAGRQPPHQARMRPPKHHESMRYIIAKAGVKNGFAWAACRALRCP